MLPSGSHAYKKYHDGGSLNVQHILNFDRTCIHNTVVVIGSAVASYDIVITLYAERCHLLIFL